MEKERFVEIKIDQIDISQLPKVTVHFSEPVDASKWSPIPGVTHVIQVFPCTVALDTNHATLFLVKRIRAALQKPLEFIASKAGDYSLSTGEETLNRLLSHTDHRIEFRRKQPLN